VKGIIFIALKPPLNAEVCTRLCAQGRELLKDETDGNGGREGAV